MTVKTHPAQVFVNALKFWPWLLLLSLVILIVWLLRLGSEPQSVASPIITATPQPSTIMSPPPSPTTPTEQAVEAPVPDGEVDPVPVVNHLPVANGEVRNQDRVHAGDDSMFLKDEDPSAKTTDNQD